MITRRHFLLLAALLSCSLPSLAAPPNNLPKIVCFGDSITAGYGVDPGHSYPDYLQAQLNARGFHYQVINEGISGNTTKDGVERIKEVLRASSSGRHCRIRRKRWIARISTLGDPREP